MFEWLMGIADRNLALSGLAFFILLMFSVELGYRVGAFIKRKGLVREGSGADAGFILGGMLALLAFFLGTALGIANSGFRDRQAVVLSEANAIGSAWLVAGAQADDAGADIQRLLETYAKVRVTAVKDVRTPEEILQAAQRTGALQNEIWAIASGIAKRTPNEISATLLTALTEAFDSSLAQRAAFDKRIPVHVVRLLIVTAVLAAIATGLNLGWRGNRMFLMSSILVLILAGSIFMISDISRPYQGATNVSPNPLIWTLQSIQSAP